MKKIWVWIEKLYNGTVLISENLIGINAETKRQAIIFIKETEKLEKIVNPVISIDDCENYSYGYEIPIYDSDGNIAITLYGHAFLSDKQMPILNFGEVESEG